MLNDIKPEDILFLDIETVPQLPEYAQLSEEHRKLWDKKAQTLIKESDSPESVYSRAGIYAEFGKIICISVGFVVNKEGIRHFRVKSFYGDDEKVLLEDFAQMLNRFAKRPAANLCAHNGKEFDFPYIARRMLITGVEIPDILDVAGKKPWEVKTLDTMELWKFGDYKHYTSLNLLTFVFNIPSPKDDIDGSQVAGCYYNGELERIVTYCEKDVLAVAQLLLRYKGLPIIEPSNIEKADA
ncbi:MAG TPA: 3'-5' exonuclease [Tenuifilaceae bacterium]|nr:3'-5' exonuclease [Tenuifilaceae bacterium]HPI46583.1 3'-5' exonuclease [Tenuifilaceae bacterium]HPN22647.1 3'-5' exonuclease [Tenuifilaceae bacterium]HPV57294.1 3'-5' exonuclease [Tenuifilaceae bacterium]